MVTGRERIQRLRDAANLSEVELRTIDFIASRREFNDVVFFCGRDGAGRRVFQFDPDLTEDERLEGARVLSRALLPFHASLLAVGVVQMVHADWTVPDCYAMRTAAQRLTADLDAQAHRTPVQELHRWIHKSMLLHTSLKLSHLIEDLLPGHLRLLEHRRIQIEGLVGVVSREDLGRIELG